MLNLIPIQNCPGGTSDFVMGIQRTVVKYVAMNRPRGYFIYMS